MHSLHSAAIEYGLDARRLRKILLDHGVIDSSSAERTNDRVLFSIEDAERWIAPLVDTLSLVKAGQYLNVPRQHAHLLFSSRFIEPVVHGGRGPLNKHAFRRSELNRFLSDLTATAMPEITTGHDIPAAAKRSNCSSMEIVQLLLEKRLQKVGLNHDSRGYLSVLVDTDEVRELVRREDHGGLSLREVERRMSWSTKVLTALIDRKLLPAKVAMNPVNRCPQRIVSEQDLDIFNRDYVSLTALAKELGIHNKAVKPRLVAIGLQPDAAFEGVPATFYRRCTLPDTLQ